MNKYYVVIDLEFAKVSRSIRKQYGSSNEIIQIGALLLNEAYEIIDRFSTFVAAKYGKLNKIISDLTKITKEDLTGAPDICTALDAMARWLPDDGDIEFVAWGESDQKQFEHELAFNHYSEPRFRSCWIDCQKLFGEYMKDPDRQYGLQNVLCIANIERFDAKEHDALSDAYNTALIFAKLKKGEMQLNEHYIRAQEAEETPAFGCTLGDLFQELMKGCA